MTQDTIDELNQKDPTEFHKQLLTHVTGLVKMSRTKMCENYSTWDLQHQVYRGERYPDDEDYKQAKKSQSTPIKMVVPNTFAQVMTFSSFLFLMFNQRSPQPFFSLLPSGAEDYGPKVQDCEAVLERHIRFNQWNKVLFQHLLDVSRFGPSILETSWTRKITRAYVEQPDTMVTYNGVDVPVRAGSEWQEFVRYEGNLVRNVSPYRFFPDTRHPISDFQKGEFCAAEEEYSIAFLKELESTGEVAGIDHIEQFTNDWVNLRGGETRTSLKINERTNWLSGPSQSKGTALVTKVQVWLVPSQFKFGPKDKKLGPEEFPILHHVWYANDNRIIRAEPAYWWHNEFGWSVSQFTPDMHQTVNLGLADLIYRLQDVISWHINARITDVRRNMRGRLVIDPIGIDESTLNGDGDIYLRKAASKSGVDRWVKQLDLKDTTSGHMVDADLLSKIMEVVTGVNGNAMGQYNSGRRSAQEARTVTAGAAGRMKMHGHLIWETGLGPTGRHMLSNARQSLSMEAFMRATGLPRNEQEAVEAQARYAAFKGSPEEVICDDDYFTFDSTLASEKGFMAQSLQELLVAIIQSDPMAAERMTRKVDPSKVMEEIQYLRGSGSMKRFEYSPEEQMAIAQEQERRLQMQHAPAPPKPPSMSLSGKMTPTQEASAAQLAGLQSGRPGEQPQATPSANGSKTK